ncbi:MAG: type I pullulanase [Treponema sp.]|jgi:pullulanase|nr:type I pullulanase [Treponema sp.]
MRKFFRIFPAVLIAAAILSCSTTPPEDDFSGITVHYYRYMEDYTGWNVWLWPADGSGEALNFFFDIHNPDRDGFVTARLSLPEALANVKEFGMIIRKSEDGNDWAEKDGNIDRVTEAREVWIRQNDPALYTSKPDTSQPPILFAAADSADKVTVILSKEPADYSAFGLYGDNKKLAGVSKRLGRNKVKITLSEKITDPSKQYIVRDESGNFEDKQVTMRNILDDYYYGGDDLGLSYRPDQSGFKVWAPTAAAVSVALYEDGGTYNAAGKVTDHETQNLHKMEWDAKTGVWSAVIKGNLAGKYYLYRAEFSDGGNGARVSWAADPYAYAVSANGQRMAIVGLDAANPPNWKRKQKPPFSAAWQDAVIYELHVRDFSIDENSGIKNRGKFLAFTERGTKTAAGAPTGVDHLVNLGITHVHLLPSFDFASVNELTVDDPGSGAPKFNWGYDPQNYNVPEGSYSSDPANPLTRIREFKLMVQALHDAGLRVVMDVVYNHTYQTGSGPFDSIVPGYYYRTTDTGALANGSACGNEVASERPMVRKYIIDSCLYWAREYDVDGFRFDLMGLIDTPTMKELTETLRKSVDPGILIYGEPWQAGGSVLDEDLQTLTGAQKGLDFAIFNDRIRTAIKGGSDDGSKGFATGAPDMEEGIVGGIRGSVNDVTACAAESINYVTAHDNLNLWDKIARSLGAKDLAKAPYDLIKADRDLFDNDAVRSALLANGIVFTSQGIPFFQAGDEFLRTKFGDHNSYASPDSINMIRWENAGRYKAAADYYAGLIKLRKEHPAFRMSRREDMEQKIEILSAEDLLVSFMLKENANGDSWRNIFVVYNGDSKPKTLSLPAGPVWRQVVSDRKAGTETLAEITAGHRGVTIPPVSMAVFRE